MELAEDKLGMGDVGSLEAIADHLISDDVPQAIARKVIGHMAPLIQKMLPSEKFEQVSNHIVRRIHAGNMAQTLEEADVLLRTALFEHFKQEGDFTAAANALAGIALENSSRVWGSPEEKSTAVAEVRVVIIPFACALCQGCRSLFIRRRDRRCRKLRE